MAPSLPGRRARVQAVHRALSHLAPSPHPEPLRADVGVLDLDTPSSPPTIPLGDALTTRRSHYTFGGLSGTTLSSLLRWSLGPGRGTFALNPTAGGLPSLTTTVVVLQPIDNISPGNYRFDPSHHQLARLHSGNPIDAIASALVQPEFARRAPALLILAGELDVTLAKYSERHYRTLHVDAGVAAAQLYLVGTALSLGCCAISGFYDDRLAEVIALRDNQIPLLAMAVGSVGENGQLR